MSGVETQFDVTLLDALRAWAITPDAGQRRKLIGHFEAMVEANTRFNLTRITDPVEAAVKHYADSLAVQAWVQKRGIEVSRMLDVGTGAGFPAVPLAIMRPDWSITAIDGTRKKIDFVAATAASVGITNLRVEHAHSSHWNTTERFDLVMSRALAKHGDALTQLAPFCRVGGYVVIYATATVSAEGKAVLKKLHLSPERSFDYVLPGQDESLKRKLLVYRKTQSFYPPNASQ